MSNKKSHPQRTPVGSSAEKRMPKQHPQALRKGKKGGHRTNMSTMALMQQRLADMGSYAKYYKAVVNNPFSVRIRCNCGRSRNMAWMFLCTFCATGTPVETAEKDGKIMSKMQKEEEKKQLNDENTDVNALDALDPTNKSLSEKPKSSKQRGFLSCDLCAQKMTESYYCPHCLAAYPAHYVKLNTRCTRCVSCPVCTSPLEKIVYSGSTTSSPSKPTGNSPLAPPGGSPNKEKKKKDVYLYQCPFCFWSSNIVGLEAAESEALLENLKQKLKRPFEQKTMFMNQIKKQYEDINEDLRKEEDRIEKSKRYHGYKSGFFSAHSSPKKRTKKGQNRFKYDNKSKLKIRGGDDSGMIPDTILVNSGSSLDGVNHANAIESMKRVLEKKFKRNHTLSKEQCFNPEPSLSDKYIQQFHLRNVAPLDHRLSAPLDQSVDMDGYIPQRFHLMTKESYKCPDHECGKYVCKPTLRGRQANYDKRTAVLDYLPRINIELKSGHLMTGAESVVLVMVQNRHLQSAKFQFDCKINENDAYSTCYTECSTDYFDIDPADIHIKGGKQQNVRKDNGDFVNGKEAGVHFTIKPKLFHPQRDIKFSVQCVFVSKMALKDDKSDDKVKELKNKKNGKSSLPLMDVTLPYILDFDLGPPRSPNVVVASPSADTSTGSSPSSIMTSSVDNTNKPNDAQT